VALAEMLDDQVLFKKNGEEGEKNAFNFLQEQNKELDEQIKNSSDAFFLPIDDFKDRKTKQPVKTPRLPYETIDVNYFFNFSSFSIGIMYSRTNNIMILVTSSTTYLTSNVGYLISSCPVKRSSEGNLKVFTPSINLDQYYHQV
jgi:hypothetical protein